LSRHIEHSGPEIALLVPQIGNRLNGLTPVRTADPKEERYRLFESVAMFLRSMAQTAGLLLCLDDLHWADKSSLLLLQHVTRRLEGARILILGTYRTVNLDRNHPLAAMLGNLSREHLYERVLLDPLSKPETSQLIEVMGNAEPDESVVTAIYRETNGNAFFVEEVVRHLLAEDRDLQQPATAVTEWGIPEGVRQVLGQRLSRLSPAASRLLQVAAVAGTELDLPVLEAAGGFDSETLMEALEEALNAGLLRDESGVCRFIHPLVRETVYDELSLPRKQRLHMQVAGAIETVHAPRLELQVQALAAHYRVAGAAADPEKAIGYSVRAGESTRAVYAWEEAAAHYAEALQSLDIGGERDDRRQCDLLLRMGEALVGAGARDRILNEVAPRALAIAQALDDDKLASAACRLAINATDGVPQYWLDTAERYVGDDAEARLILNVPQAATALHGGRFAETRRLVFEAIELARRIGDPAGELNARSFALRIGAMPADEEQRLFEEMQRLPAEALSARDRGNVVLDAVMLDLERGNRQSAAMERDKLARFARETHHEFASSAAAASDALFAMLDGRLHEALEATYAATRGSFPRTWRGRLAGWLGNLDILDAERTRAASMQLQRVSIRRSSSVRRAGWRRPAK
jgi:hypothetical protein